MKRILQSTILLVAVLALSLRAQASDGLTILGDVNCDADVNIGDVTDLIDHLMGGDSGDFSADNADVNRDGVVNISDVTDLIDYLLGGTWPDDGYQPVTETFTVNGVTFTMVTVEGGSFMMGATPDQGDEPYNNSPECYPVAHEVKLSGYSIGQTEVSQSLWKAVMGVHPSYFRFQDNLPVENVSWHSCYEFILKLNALTGKQFRLPTEAEWEFAARGGNRSQGYKYSGSNDIDECGWYYGNAPTHESAMISLYGTQPIATKAPNELGLYDMSGNVLEWCQDYEGQYSSNPDTDPIGPNYGQLRVCRGGSWASSAPECRVSIPFGGLNGNEHHGLRLVLDDDNSAKFRFAESVVTVAVGDSRSVDFINGCGDYRIVSGSEMLDCEVVGGKLVVKGAAAGTTTVHVIDAATGVTAVLAVIVKPVENYTVNGVTFSMVAVEGGSFSLGRNWEAGVQSFDWEAADSYRIELSDYCIGKTEVTQELWQAVMGTNPSYFKGDPKRPVEQVSWDDCQEFIIKLNEMTGLRFRLPTEAEWEYAACGGHLRQATEYSGGNDINEVAWYKGNIPSQSTQPVGTKSPNELGIHDMNGNVWEWCQDWSDGFNHYEPFSNAGMPTGTHRMRRGGCWSSTQENCGVLVYGSSWPSEKNNRMGLRLVIGGEDNYPQIYLSEREMTLSVGESRSVDINYGWGKYSIQKPEGVNCTVNGEKLIVTATSPTSGTVVVVNEYTGEKAQLEVTVHGQEGFTVNGVSFNMAYVSGGKFSMGSINGEVLYPDNTGDPHEVTLSPYYIGVTEVTQELWKAVMGDNPSYFTPANGYTENLLRPVETVSWEDCQEFIARLNELTGRQFCLPSEAQWEYAARGAMMSHGFTYAGSNNINDVAWYKNNTPSQTDRYGTQTVATKAPNELGLFDMSGNVMEWVNDWYGDYSWGDIYDPVGSYDGTERVARGGCWFADAQYCQVVWRESGNPSGRNHVTGLRLAIRLD